ncbi:hypothetical protein DFH07DRAFT_683723, partial [Mycena maculata]
WQLDVSEVFLLGLDVVAIARMGAGKTMPFMMPLLLHRDKYSLVISPLKVLQEDQAKRFEKMGLKAVAVNGDTYSRDLQKGLSSHCTSQWGRDFRPHYALLDRLRVLLPAGSPILATSATSSPAALKDICLSLDLDLDEAFFINLGNDHPNITPSVIKMNSAKDYAAINAHLPKLADVRSAVDLPKGLVFTNTGANIPDIELIIQFGVPGSLPIWVQCAGRAGRSPELQARAILLIEKSMFQRKKKRKRKGKAKGEADSGSSLESEDEGGAAAVPKSAGGFYALDTAAPVQPQERPMTPDQSSPPSSAHSTPSKNTNANGKRPIVRRNGPKTRRKDHLQTARAALERWRLGVLLERYQKSSIREAAIMPDPVLTALASHRIDSPDTLKELSPSWMLARWHGEEILEILRRVDEGVRVEKEREKL